MARSRRLIEKARGNGTLRTAAGSEHPVSYTVEVRQEVVDGLPGTSEIDGYVTLPGGVALDSPKGVLVLRDGRTTEVVLQLGEASAGRAQVKFRGGAIRPAGRA